MLSALYRIFTIIINVELIIGILANGFITVVNCFDWVKMRKISLADRILTALAISRICMMLVMMVSCLSDFRPFSYMSAKTIMLINVAAAMANHFSMWMAMILSLFYFLKIANYSNPIFLHLKYRVEMVVKALLLGNLAFLIVNFIILGIYVDSQLHLLKKNLTSSYERNIIEKLPKLMTFTVGSFIPFSVSLNSFLLLIFSLRKHLKNMKVNRTGLRDPSVKAHIRAMKSVVAFLLLFAIYFLNILITTFPSEAMKNRFVPLLCQTIANVYPTVHSLLLILENSKLRKISLSVMWQLRCG
ncbi:taste receptor type 2 member 13-like [Oryctolagus cuniculus]|uniref:taste receptor type 2 member 13-like n=1 Tax=Oryctolagus cuniculus TaxID=9986 RepID=UPI003879237F